MVIGSAVIGKTGITGIMGEEGRVTSACWTMVRGQRLDKHIIAQMNSRMSGQKDHVSDPFVFIIISCYTGRVWHTGRSAGGHRGQLVTGRCSVIHKLHFGFLDNPDLNSSHRLPGEDSNYIECVCVCSMLSAVAAGVIVLFVVSVLLRFFFCHLSGSLANSLSR